MNRPRPMKKYRSFGLIAACFTASHFLPSAEAQLITETQTIAYTVSADSTAGSGGYYFSFDTLVENFARWNYAEPLVSVAVEINGRNAGSFFVGSATAQTITTATAQQNFTFLGGGGAPPSLFDASPYNLTTVPGPLPQLSTVGMLNLENGLNDWQLNGTYTFTDPAQLLYFTGPGTFGLQMNNLLQITATDGTVIGGGLVSTGEVVVTMSSVPEPSSVVLLAFGGVILASVFLRRRTRRA